MRGNGVRVGAVGPTSVARQKWPVDIVIENEAEHVITNSGGERAGGRECRWRQWVGKSSRYLAEIDVDVFGFGCPVSNQLRLDAGAKRPALQVPAEIKVAQEREEAIEIRLA